MAAGSRVVTALLDRTWAIFHSLQETQRTSTTVITMLQKLVCYVAFNNDAILQVSQQHDLEKLPSGKALRVRVGQIANRANRGAPKTAESRESQGALQNRRIAVRCIICVTLAIVSILFLCKREFDSWQLPVLFLV